MGTGWDDDDNGQVPRSSGFRQKGEKETRALKKMVYKLGRFVTVVAVVAEVGVE